MGKVQFLEALKAELAVLPAEERESAIKYYDEYFEEAGEENEQTVIAELGSPQKVGEKIKGVYYANNPHYAPKAQPQAQTVKKNSKLPVWAIILIALIAIPVLGPIAISLLSALFTVFVTVIVVLFVIAILGIVLFIAGIVLTTFGIVTMFATAMQGLLIVGAGFVLIGIGLIMTLVTAKLCFKAIPVFIRWFVDLCKKPFNRNEVAA